MPISDRVLTTAEFMRWATEHNWGSVPASKGTVAYEYLHGHRLLELAHADPDLVAVIEDPLVKGGYMWIFRDQSSVARVPAGAEKKLTYMKLTDLPQFFDKNPREMN